MESLQIVFGLGVLALLIAACWKVFEKAGQPGWASLVPFYSTYVYLRIAGRPGWWMVLLLIPVVNVGIAVMASVSLAARFGRGTGFGIGLAVLGFVFLPMLAFGNDEYSPGELRRAA
jgi:hypothetical protein